MTKRVPGMMHSRIIRLTQDVLFHTITDGCRTQILTSFCQYFYTHLLLAEGMWQESSLNVLVCLADKCRRCHGEVLR